MSLSVLPGLAVPLRSEFSFSVRDSPVLQLSQPAAATARTEPGRVGKLWAGVQLSISQPKGMVQRIQSWLQLQLQDRLHGKGVRWKPGHEGAVHGPARGVIVCFHVQLFLVLWLRDASQGFHSELPESGEQQSRKRGAKCLKGSPSSQRKLMPVWQPI